MHAWTEKVDIALIEEDPNNFNRQSSKVFNTLVAEVRKVKTLLSVPLLRVIEWKDKAKKIPARYRIVDGHHRVNAYKAAGLTAPIFCIITDMDDKEAAKHLMSMNKLTGEPDDMLLNNLVRKMVTELHVSAEEIVAETGYTTTEVDSMLSKLELAVGTDLNPGIGQGMGESVEVEEPVAFTWEFHVTAKQNMEIDKAYRLAVELIEDTSDSKVLAFICKEFMESIEKKGMMPKPKAVRTAKAGVKGAVQKATL